MVSTCFLCKWRSDKYPRRSYHKFPSNEELKQKWLNILGKNNVSIGPRTSLCCLHFEENCFRYGLVNGRKILKDGSLPTLYLTNWKIQNQTINLVCKTELPLSSTESTLQIQHPSTDDVHMEDTTSKLDLEDNPVEVPIKIYSPKGLLQKSGPLDLPSKIDDIPRLKRKVTTLKRSVKRLRHSKHEIKSQLIELKKRIRKYEPDNKLIYGQNNIIANVDESSTDSEAETQDSLEGEYENIKIQIVTDDTASNYVSAVEKNNQDVIKVEDDAEQRIREEEITQINCLNMESQVQVTFLAGSDTAKEGLLKRKLKQLAENDVMKSKKLRELNNIIFIKNKVIEELKEEVEQLKAGQRNAANPNF